MDDSKPWKVIRCPLPLGVCSGLAGKVLDEYLDESTAQAMMYEEHMGDKGVYKGIYYYYDVAHWPVVLLSNVDDPTNWNP